MVENPGFQDLALAYVCTKFLETLIVCARQSIFSLCTNKFCSNKKVFAHGFLGAF